MRKAIGVSFLVLVLASCGGGGAKSAFVNGVNPCSEEGLSTVKANTMISKPAGGNLDEVDPKATVDQKLEALKDVNLHADQCRAVLGEIPSISCPDAAILPLTKDGKKLTYAQGVFLEDGKPTTWVPRQGCDKPGLLSFLRAALGPGADPDEGCLPNARVAVKKIGPVTWAATCHFFNGPHETSDKFDFVAVIGSNDKTGETCFFSHDFQLKDEKRTHGKNLIPPGGYNPKDPVQRAESKAFWNPTDYFVCMQCHGNNKAWLITPHVNQSRVGHGDGNMEFLPETPRSLRLQPQWGYRIIGTNDNLYMNHKREFNRPELHEIPKTVYPKNDDGTEDRTCTRCHLLPDQENYLRLARVSVGLRDLEKNLVFTGRHHLDPKPWMPPAHDGSPEDTKKYQAAVMRYERALRDPAWRFKPAENILAPCPAPAALASERVQVLEGRDSNKVQWNYKNDRGEVPNRDDVRFQVTIQGSDGATCAIRDVAPKALGSDSWTLNHPKAAGVTYEYTLKPYRYCFQETVYEYGTETKAKAKP